MFLAHFSNTPLREILEMEPDEAHFWYLQAVEVHNHLNEVDEKPPAKG